MVVLGVTGGLGSGKSTVTRMFHQLGAVAVDADALAHEVIEPERPAWREIVTAFGREILNADRTINRRRLGAIVFADARRRRRLEAIVHPRVLRELRRLLRRLREERRAPVVVVEVPLLFEAGARGAVDAVVVVTAPPAVRRARLQRHGWSKREVAARMAAQWTLSAKAALADYIVENAAGKARTRAQVKRIWNQLGPYNNRSTPRTLSR